MKYDYNSVQNDATIAETCSNNRFTNNLWFHHSGAGDEDATKAFNITRMRTPLSVIARRRN